MLLSFRVQNFRSIRDEQELSLLRSRRIAAHQHGAGSSGLTVTPVAGIYGSNASGKSNLISAMEFFGNAVTGSHSQWSPDGGTAFDPFLLNQQHRQRPMRSEIEFLHDDIRFQYGFELDGHIILREWLYAYPHTRRQTWFERDIDREEEWYFGKVLGGHNRVISDLTRPNSLFLSTAAASKHGRLSELYRWFSRNLRVANSDNARSRLAFTISELQDRVEVAAAFRKLVAIADLGICDVKIRRKDFSAEERERFARLYGLLSEGHDGRPALQQDEEIDKALHEIGTTIELQHACNEGSRKIGLPFKSESLGTRALVALAGPILQALRLGETLLVDEIGTSLHPRLLAEVVRIFQTPKTNPNQAQLIFTSHDTSLLGNLVADEPVLERDQIWFVEKNRDGATELYPATDFTPRKLENIERGYLQGRYGAIPFISSSEHFSEPMFAEVGE